MCIELFKIKIGDFGHFRAHELLSCRLTSSCARLFYTGVGGRNEINDSINSFFMPYWEACARAAMELRSNE